MGRNNRKIRRRVENMFRNNSHRGSFGGHKSSFGNRPTNRRRGFSPRGGKGARIDVSKFINNVASSGAESPEKLKDSLRKEATPSRAIKRII